MGKRSRTIRLRGEDVRLIFTHPVMLKHQGQRYECSGLCDPPGTRNRAIRIDSELQGVEKLEFMLHEMLHFCQWDLDESVIEEMAHDMATVLDQAGYREARP